MSGRLAVRLVTAAFVAGSAGLGFVPLAHASSQTTVTPGQEAWYQPNPTCAQPTGCVTPASLPVTPPAPVPLSPYPAGTLHIGYTGGQETARTYLALPVDGIEGQLLGASLDVPLDTAAADGNQSPETSHIQACLFTSDITPADGSIAAPPDPSCSAHATVSYVATPTPHLHADLGPLLTGLLTTRGIALLPDNLKVTQTDAWRVVFSSHSRADAAKTPPATVTFTLDDAVVQEPVSDVALPSQDNAGLGGIAPPVGTGFAATPTDVPAAAAPAPAVVAPAAPVPQALPRTITVGYAYPVVWLLPLAFLVLVPATARALTKDLAPRPLG